MNLSQSENDGPPVSSHARMQAKRGKEDFMSVCFEGLRGFRARAVDDELGKIKDVFFDDATWQIRYLIVDSGRWLPRRRVLIAPEAVERIDPSRHLIHFKLTKQQLQDSPYMNDDVPVSRAQQLLLHEYFGWDQFWLGPTGPTSRLLKANHDAVFADDKMMPELNQMLDERHALDIHLQSSRDVQGFQVNEADTVEDGERIGRLDDLLLNLRDWAIPYLVVDTKAYRIGGRVLFPTFLVQSVNEGMRNLYTLARRETASSAPEFHSVEQLGRDYEEQVVRHYLEQQGSGAQPAARMPGRQAEVPPPQ